MNNDVQRDASCHLFQFEGELRADHVEGLYALVTASDDPTPRHVLVDCHRVTRFDDNAVAALSAFQQAVADLGGKVLLMGIGHPSIDNVVLFEPREQEPPLTQAI